MTRESFEKLIRQNETKKVIDELLYYQCPTTKMDIWSTIEIKNYSATKLYEKFYEVVNILAPEALPTLEGQAENGKENLKITRKNFEIYETNLKISGTLLESITAMLREFFQTEINQETIEQPEFLTKVVPKYLEGKDRGLLFERLWKILEELEKEYGFNEEQICCAWGVSLCHVLDYSK